MSEVNQQALDSVTEFLKEQIDMAFDTGSFFGLTKITLLSEC